MNKRGQSIIEYALIAVLVILGVVLMGPYVLRSVGAHFKLWDEGVKDSFTENLRQAPVNDVPTVPLTCTSCRYIAGSCGSSIVGGPGSCLANQREYDLNCGADPIGCSGQPASTCQNDPLCCTSLEDIGCGTTPIGHIPPSNNCNFGYEIQAKQCGSNNTVHCALNSSCNAQCLGAISPGAIACPNEPPVSGTLNQNYSINYVAINTACVSPCQYYCDTANSYVLNSNGTGCIKTFQVAASIPNCSSAGACADCSQSGHITTNKCDFTMCLGPSQSILAISVAFTSVGIPTSPPIPVTGDGCQNPNASGVDEGEPGDNCQMTTTY